MKNKKSLWWIVVIIALPFVIMFGLHIGIALGNYFHVNINVPNIDAASWFMFFGSYLGGVMTLAGVMITLRYERQIHQCERSIENIEKEKEKVGKAICGFDLLAPRALYLQANEILASPTGFNPSDLVSLRLRVNEEMNKALLGNAELEFYTDIYFMQGNCAACRRPCELQTIIPEFVKIYNSVGSKLYDTHNTISDYILAIERNQARIAAGLRDQIENIKPYQDKIDASLEEIAKFNQKEIQQLMGLGRKYIGQKEQNAYKNCFPVKEDRK